MRSTMLPKQIVALLLLPSCAGCASTVISNDVPHCEKLVPDSLLKPTESADIPEVSFWPDGHEKAEPWEVRSLQQDGQLEKANEKPAAVDHIYRTCLELHREELKNSQRGFFRRLFG